MASESARTPIARPRPQPITWRRRRRPSKSVAIGATGVALVVTLATHGAPFVALADLLSR